MSRNVIRMANGYRQVRLTYTEEVSGRISYAVYVKPLGKAWTESQCVIRDTLHAREQAGSMDDVFERLEAIASMCRWAPTEGE